MRILGAMLVCLCMSFGSELEGYYMTHKGVSGQQSIIEFFKLNDKYYAYGFVNVDGSPPKKDVKNPNPALRNRTDKGVVFMYNLVRDGDSDVFKDGRAYDFDGHTYNVKITIVKNELQLRFSVDKSGFIGETKVWRRLSQEEVKPYLSQKPDFSVVLESLKDIQP